MKVFENIHTDKNAYMELLRLCGVAMGVNYGEYR